MTSLPETYHIVGGGIAGLAAAWYLKRRYPGIRSVVYEAGERLGGRAYSYDDAGLGIRLDNAVHAIVGANRFMAAFVKKNEWIAKVPFLDMAGGGLSTSAFANRQHILKSFCNTAPEEIAPSIKRNILRQTFPWTASTRKVWFSGQDLSQRINNMLAGYADEVHLNCRLNKIAAQFGVAAQLEFSTGQAEVGSRDKVIVALDNLSCRKVLDIIPLEHNQIVNIIYQTSQRIYLPGGASLLGVTGGTVDWLFAGNGLLSAVISDYHPQEDNLTGLAMKVWQEIDKIRGVNSAFMPPYKAFCCKNATIRQDEGNNLRRPRNALTSYPNVFIAGDWTMQNYPCCMETAVRSAIRAVKTAIKSV